MEKTLLDKAPERRSRVRQPPGPMHRPPTQRPLKCRRILARLPSFEESFPFKQLGAMAPLGLFPLHPAMEPAVFVRRDMLLVLNIESGCMKIYDW
jgi:hypothetical protein